MSHFNCDFVAASFTAIIYDWGTILYYFQSGTSVVVNAMLGVIMITRLYAMYQRSRKMLVFLVVFFFAVNITCAVIAASSRVSGVSSNTSGDRSLRNLSVRFYWRQSTSDNRHMDSNYCMGGCLAVWIVAKYLRELQQPSARSTLGSYFRVSIETHVFYFAAYATVTCLNLGSLSPNIENSSSLGVDIYNGILQIAQAVQMFVLGPRLILSVRECHAKANSDEGIDMSTIAFQEL
ncbi:hypothetical protein BDR05DRAFT_1003743 [Suillus weaverae]|nr:hypothetical protein BDR05DRAFT_1003743 [Suillus weaverae]